MKSIRCPKCDLVTMANAANCKRCGAAFPQSVDSAEQNFKQTSVHQPTDFPNAPAKSFSGNTNQFQATAPPSSINSPYSNHKSEEQTSEQVWQTAPQIPVNQNFPPQVPAPSYPAYQNAPHPQYPQQYQQFPPPKSGSGGTVAIIVGVIAVCLIVGVVFIGIIAAIAIPNLLAARRAANEGAAMSSLRTLAGAEYKYSQAEGKGTCGSLEELGNAQLIDPTLASGKKIGYNFSVTKNGNGCSLSATPSVTSGAAATGIRSFYAASWEGWKIHAANKNGLPADERDPVLAP